MGISKVTKSLLIRMSTYAKMAYYELRYIRMRLESVINEIRLTRKSIEETLTSEEKFENQIKEGRIYEKWFLQ